MGRPVAIATSKCTLKNRGPRTIARFGISHCVQREGVVKVTIIDDSKVMRAIVKRTLRQAGFNDIDVAEACDGEEGLQVISDTAPDLVLCDWNMPKMTGMELLERLRSLGNTVRFGFVTSEGSEEMRAKARDAGAAFLISKPFKPEDFRESIDKAMAA